MKDKIPSNVRKWLGVIAAMIIYYIIHEGAHIVVALIYGVFEKIKILGLGVQVVTNIELLTNIQKAIFCVAGSISTLVLFYLLLILTNKIVKSKNKIFKASCYYTTIAMMLIDPLYLSILYKFFGGGDMNGIILFGLPEILFQIIYGIIGIINVLIFIKMVYPQYKKVLMNNMY